jgi:hypothetical protein
MTATAESNIHKVVVHKVESIQEVDEISDCSSANEKSNSLQRGADGRLTMVIEQDETDKDREIKKKAERKKIWRRQTKEERTDAKDLKVEKQVTKGFLGSIYRGDSKKARKNEGRGDEIPDVAQVHESPPPLHSPRKPLRSMASLDLEAEDEKIDFRMQRAVAARTPGSPSPSASSGNSDASAGAPPKKRDRKNGRQETTVEAEVEVNPAEEVTEREEEPLQSNSSSAKSEKIIEMIQIERREERPSIPSEERPFPQPVERSTFANTATLYVIPPAKKPLKIGSVEEAVRILHKPNDDYLNEVFSTFAKRIKDKHRLERAERNKEENISEAKEVEEEKEETGTSKGSISRSESIGGSARQRRSLIRRKLREEMMEKLRNSEEKSKEEEVEGKAEAGPPPVEEEEGKTDDGSEGRKYKKKKSKKSKKSSPRLREMSGFPKITEGQGEDGEEEYYDEEELDKILKDEEEERKKKRKEKKEKKEMKEKRRKERRERKAKREGEADADAEEAKNDSFDSYRRAVKSGAIFVPRQKVSEI